MFLIFHCLFSVLTLVHFAFALKLFLVKTKCCLHYNAIAKKLLGKEKQSKFNLDSCAYVITLFYKGNLRRAHANPWQNFPAQSNVCG